MLDESAAELRRDRTTVHYLLCSVKESNASDIEPLLRKVVAEVKAHDGTILGILPPLLLATFGLPQQAGASFEKRLTSAAESLLTALPNEVKLIYGTSVGEHGIVDFSGFSIFGIILPRTEERLRVMLNLKYGEMARFD